MGLELWLVASILTASCTTVAREVDWKKVDDTCRGCSFCISGPMTLR